MNLKSEVITRELERIRTGNIEWNCSALKSRLLSTICSVRKRSRKKDIDKKVKTKPVPTPTIPVDPFSPSRVSRSQSTMSTRRKERDNDQQSHTEWDTMR